MTPGPFAGSFCRFLLEEEEVTATKSGEGRQLEQ